jgi:hypothetical protein
MRYGTTRRHPGRWGATGDVVRNHAIANGVQQRAASRGEHIPGGVPRAGISATHLKDWANAARIFDAAMSEIQLPHTRSSPPSPVEPAIPTRTSTPPMLLLDQEIDEPERFEMENDEDADEDEDEDPTNVTNGLFDAKPADLVPARMTATDAAIGDEDLVDVGDETWQKRNSDLLQQPIPPRVGKKSAAAATADVASIVKKTMLGNLQADVEEVAKGVDAQISALAAKYHRPETEIRGMVAYKTGIKKTRKATLHNAIVHHLSVKTRGKCFSFHEYHE